MRQFSSIMSVRRIKKKGIESNEGGHGVQAMQAHDVASIRETG